METLADRVMAAIEALARGEVVLIFDSADRENETDMVALSENVTPATIALMRKNAGGLICATVDGPTARLLGMPYYSEVVKSASNAFPVFRGLVPDDLRYDARSAFSITFNHRETFTGVTDIDRARTISEFGRLCSSIPDNGMDARAELSRRFRTPGHVHLLIADHPPLVRRSGHTELATALLGMGGLTRSAAICEMLSDEGCSLPESEAREYASARGLVFLEGKDIISACSARGVAPRGVMRWSE